MNANISALGMAGADGDTERKKLCLKEGDFLTLIDLGDGKLMFTPGVSEFLTTADKIAEELEKAGVTLDELLETLDEERKRYYKAVAGSLSLGL